MRPLPYVGVTGYMNRYEAEHVVKTAPKRKSPIILMTGVLASWKTLQGLEPSQPGRYPALYEIEGIFPKHPRSLNLIHYNTRQLDTLAEQLRDMKRWGGERLHGFQFNIAWPPLIPLRAYREWHPDSVNVLQIGGKAMEQMGYDVRRIAHRASGYREIARYVLIDPSGGRGEPFDPAFARTVLRALYDHLPDMGIGLAGGLSAAGVKRHLPKLLEEFPGLSTDAEGRIRTKRDALDLKKTDAYVRARMELAP